MDPGCGKNLTHQTVAVPENKTDLWIEKHILVCEIKHKIWQLEIVPGGVVLADRKPVDC